MAPPKVKSPTEDDRVIGRNLRSFRRARQLTQKALGDALSMPVSLQQIQKYEAGTNRITVSRLLQFAKILNVPIDSFFDGIPNTTPTPSEGQRDVLRDQLNVLNASELRDKIRKNVDQISNTPALSSIAHLTSTFVTVAGD